LKRVGRSVFKFEGVCFVLNSAYESSLIGSSDSQTIAETIAAAQKGDEAAFIILFQTYNTRICTYLAHMVGNEEEGCDLAQETFLKAWRAFPQTNKELRFEAL
jgi:anthranilate phosphoribosyltransferase